MGLVVIVIVWSVGVGVADSEDFPREQLIQKGKSNPQTKSLREKKREERITERTLTKMLYLPLTFGHKRDHKRESSTLQPIACSLFAIIPIMPLEGEEPRFIEE